MLSQELNYLVRKYNAYFYEIILLCENPIKVRVMVPNIYIIDEQKNKQK